MILIATIEKLGDDFPATGDYVPGEDGNLYRVLSVSTPAPHSVFAAAKLEKVSWDECPEGQEHQSEVLVDW